MGSGFWAGSVPSWALVCGGCLCVLFLLLGGWFGVGRRDRVYDRGYDDGQADAFDHVDQQAASVRGVAMVKRAAMIAWEQTHPVPLEELPPPLGPEEWAVPLEYPPAEPAYAWEPWSLSADTTLEEEIAAMIANADAAPSVRWLASLEPGQ
jgi:hypothetical protein